MNSGMRCFFLGVSWNESAVSAHFRALGTELVQRGHRVVFIVDGQRKQVENHADNPAIFTWPSKRPVKVQDARFLARLIRTYRPDCVIGNFGSVNMMTLVGRTLHVPARVAWHHTLSGQIDIDTALSARQVQALRLRKRAIYGLATHVVANSRATERDVQSTFGVPAAKCKILPILISDPCLDSQELPLRQKYKIVCVGALLSAKGQDVLLQAVPQLIARYPATCVEFIGDGPMRDHYLQMAEALRIADHCQFPGFLSNQEVLRRMAAATVVVVPSHAEAFGIVNIEALSVGTPIVASNVGGIRDIVRDGVDGYLVPPADPASLADALAKVLDGGPGYEAMRRSARDRFLQEYEISRGVGVQADWYESLSG